VIIRKQTGHIRHSPAVRSSLNRIQILSCPDRVSFWRYLFAPTRPIRSSPRFPRAMCSPGSRCRSLGCCWISAPLSSDAAAEKWGGPLSTALALGMSEAAKVLAERGARIDLPAAAGLGLVGDAARLLPSADAEARHRALSLAAQHGHADIVRLLLDAARIPAAITSKATMRTRRRCTKPSWGAAKRWCGSWRSAACGSISGTPSGGARRSVGRCMAAEGRRRGWPSVCVRSAQRSSPAFAWGSGLRRLPHLLGTAHAWAILDRRFRPHALRLAEPSSRRPSPSHPRRRVHRPRLRVWAGEALRPAGVSSMG
jgi:hypothetical protein